MNGHAENYLERLQAFRESDKERDALVTDLIKKYQDLQTKYEEKCDDYENEVESRRSLQSNARETARELVALRQASGSNPFVLVILDGDGAVFQDYLYASGREGGAEAASMLQQAIKNQLKELYPDANLGDWQIVVNVVLNVQGLGKKLQSCNIISSAMELQSFGRAFGLAQPLFNFIDVGDGKERADHKIRETIRLFLPIPQCKHVFFGPTLDNGYLPFLEPFKRDALVAPRMTLVETRPSEPGFINLGFRRTKFLNIFRDTNLPSRPIMPAPMASPVGLPVRTASTMHVSASNFVPQSTAGAHQAQKSTSPAPSMDSATSSSWATVGKGTVAGKNINIAPTKKVSRPFIMLNVDDDRLDPPLPRTDPGAEKRFGTRLKEVGKCCNDFHLLGKCAAGEYCDYIHGEKLSPGEMLVLKHKARSRSCPKKHTCRAFDCTFGHHCKYGKSCLMDSCWFADTHYVDLEPAKRFYEDGSEEWSQEYLDRYRS